MLFTALRSDSDYNQWGGRNWWQNARMPYYNMLFSGDADMVDAASFRNFQDTLEYAKMKTQVYYPNMTPPVAYWDEPPTESRLRPRAKSSRENCQGYALSKCT
ncbi:hypothetical protein FOL47_011031 [Perkinsus chesapeaki]|uniref:Uncharacterized protein n=1 Tax=Perkinsus chesapeaki TaxID=330153 RepID=A0A7J6KYX2_PERCH|nr:hypothetical protein FOL47_011031 [Perkinsus chesapeaki]